MFCSLCDVKVATLQAPGRGTYTLGLVSASKGAGAIRGARDVKKKGRKERKKRNDPSVNPCSTLRTYLWRIWLRRKAGRTRCWRACASSRTAPANAWSWPRPARPAAARPRRAGPATGLRRPTAAGPRRSRRTCAPAVVPRRCCRLLRPSARGCRHRWRSANTTNERVKIVNFFSKSFFTIAVHPPYCPRPPRLGALFPRRLSCSKCRPLAPGVCLF